MNSYNKFILSLFSCLFFIGNIQSQNSTIGSLENKLLLHTKKDTLRVNLLNDLAFSYCKNDLEKTIVYIEESETIAKTIDFKKGIARGIYVRGVATMSQSNFDKAIEIFNEALLVYEKIDSNKGIIECNNSIGLANYYQGNYMKSIVFFNKIITINKENGNEKNNAIPLKYIGYVYTDSSNYKEAILYFNKALRINKKYNDEHEIASCFNNMGIVYEEKSNLPLALEYYNKSLYISKKLNDTVSISKVLNNIGIIYKNNENYEKAIENYEFTLKIQKKIGDKKYIAKVLNNLGIVYNRKEDFKRALVYLEEALKISKEINDKDQISSCLNNIGDVYLLLNKNTIAYQHYMDAKKINIEINDLYGLSNSYIGIAIVYTNQRKYDKALTNALKSLELSKELGLLNLKRDANELLSRIFYNTGDYNKALISHKKYKRQSDSLFNKENIEKITQLEYEYKYKQELDSASVRELRLTKTVKTTSQNLEKTQSNILLGVIAFLIMALVLGAIIFFLKLRNEKTKTQNIVIEQKLLRSQMTPHFIFNSLSVLQGMILNKEEKMSVSYLSKFSKLLRITLENSRYKTVLLSQELTAIENYLSLQNLENKLYKYTVLVDDTIDISIFKIPPMLIQPFIENAIEHAFKNQNKIKTIDVHLSYFDKELVCTIVDNGIGIDSKKENNNQHKKSLSTTITSERLKTLSKDFKMKGSVSIEDRQKYNEQGTMVTLVIPYKIQDVKETVT